MLDDFTLVSHKLDKGLPYVNIYPLGDLHIGSGNFSQESFDRWKKMVLDDPYSRVVLVGDLMDNGLKTSRTNSYDATMTPHDQKRWLSKELAPMAPRILGAVQGNHEYRSTVIADIYPLYDVLEGLGLEDVYRQNMCFLKINLGRRTTDRQCSYTLVLAHGASKTKTEKFSYAIDGMDALITGHIHQPKSAIQSKIVIDNNNEVIRMKDFVHMTVPSFQALGGYALRGMYMPQSSTAIPVIGLSGTEKNISVKWL